MLFFLNAQVLRTILDKDQNYVFGVSEYNVQANLFVVVVVVDIQSELIPESVSENISDTQKYDNHSNKLKDLSK